MPFWTNCQLVDKFAENDMNPHTLMFEHSTLPLVSKQGGLYASFFRVLVIVFTVLAIMETVWGYSSWVPMGARKGHT